MENECDYWNLKVFKMKSGTTARQTHAGRLVCFRAKDDAMTPVEWETLRCNLHSILIFGWGARITFGGLQPPSSGLATSLVFKYDFIPNFLLSRLLDLSNVAVSVEQGTKVCRYNWHSAGFLGWPFPVLKYKYSFQIKYTEAIFTARCYASAVL